ncbi:MAG: protein translocase subunit SecD [Phycisphaerae bacterium]|nr:protein translocase subunit SecD [Phycisphaerae bacterium]
MSGKNLPFKFAALALAVGVCILALTTKGCKEGIDLRGGYTITLGIQTPQVELAKANEAMDQLRADLAAATSADARATIEQRIKDQETKIDSLKRASENRNVAQEVITTLKERVDPTGLTGLEWRALSDNRIEVRMPAGTEESRRAQAEYQRRLEELTANPVLGSRIDEILKQDAAGRAQSVAEVARHNANQAKWLEELFVLKADMDRKQQALADLKAKSPAAPPATQEGQPGWDIVLAQRAAEEAGFAYEEMRQQIEANNLTAKYLTRVFENFVSHNEASALKKAGKSEDILVRRAQYDDLLARLKRDHADRATEIDELRKAFEHWVENRRPLDDPQDLMRVIRRSGVLEFRMAPVVGGEHNIDHALAQQYITKLETEGPDPGHERNDAFLWFPIRGRANSLADTLVKHPYGGRVYVLLDNRTGNIMLNPPGARNWELTHAAPNMDGARHIVSFEFDTRGARLFRNLTASHIRHNMAVLLDDEVYTAPVINDVISNRGQISGDFTAQDAADLAKTLRSGSLPAKVNSEPLAISTFGSALGQVYKEKSIYAGIISLIAISVLMLTYYFFNGSLAVFALVLNLLFTVGAMSLLDASFTLPGIAGIILMIGMAVDANVLINERLREETQRNIPPKMAVKNAYDRAFTAIFDSHVTVLVTSIILGWVGTEEVRGFAIALGLGIVFNLFTAVFVTRWCLQVWLSFPFAGKTHFRMMPWIRVPKINWVGMRNYFWTFSGICLAVSIVAVALQGSTLLGVEFTKGTRATLVFRPDAMLNGQLLDDKIVREKFHAAASALAARDDQFATLAREPRMETVLDDNRVREFLDRYDTNRDNRVTREEFEVPTLQHEAGNPEFFTRMDPKGAGVLTRDDLTARLPNNSFRLTTTETRVELIKEAAKEAFGDQLVNRQRVTFDLARSEGPWTEEIGITLSSEGLTPLHAGSDLEALKAKLGNNVGNFENGVLLVLTNASPRISAQEFTQRIKEMQVMQNDADLSSAAMNMHYIVGLGESDNGKYASFAVFARQPDMAPGAWDAFSRNEFRLIHAVLDRDDAIIAINFDAQIAGETAQLAIVAVVLSWLAIIAYLWFRFGSVSWGLAAVVCLVQNAIVAIGFIAMSHWVAPTGFGKLINLGAYQIDLMMVAAVLTIIGYSVNDTIVIFDRIRENRGKLTHVTPAIINLAINQTMGRTILTTATALIVLVIMYIFGGEGMRGFTYALLIGIAFGCYSTVAIASPLLLVFRSMSGRRAAAEATTATSTDNE